MDIIEDLPNVAGISGNCEVVVDFADGVLFGVEARPFGFLFGYFL